MLLLEEVVGAAARLSHEEYHPSGKACRIGHVDMLTGILTRRKKMTQLAGQHAGRL
jgi:hypothetical protein